MIDLQTYSERIGIAQNEILTECRKSELVTARQVYFFYLKTIGYTLHEIGRIFDKDHSTVYYGIGKVKDWLSINDKYLEKYLDAIDYKH